MLRRTRATTTFFTVVLMTVAVGVLVWSPTTVFFFIDGTSDEGPTEPTMTCSTEQVETDEGSCRNTADGRRAQTEEIPFDHTGPDYEFDDDDDDDEEEIEEEDQDGLDPDYDFDEDEEEEEEAENFEEAFEKMQKLKEAATADTADPTCRNQHAECDFWANLTPSECTTNPDFMLQECRLACRDCKKHKTYSEIEATPDGRDLGEPQNIMGDGNISQQDMIDQIVLSQHYMSQQLREGKIDAELLHICKNKDELCTFWSLIGECEENVAYMKTNCGPACRSCDMLSIATRCPMDRETIGPDVWSTAGELEAMFTRITSEPYKSQYAVQILSCPTCSQTARTTSAKRQQKHNKDGGPWVITLDNFVTEREAARLIEMGAIEGYERSTDVGDMNPDGTTGEVVSKGRTSTNAWCSNDCIKDPVVQQVTTRIANLTHFPMNNSEDLQLLRYEPGQRYTRHHDYIEYEIDRQEGVRLVTVYLYLNDVEAGGGTNFPDLNITVMPKRGRVLIWPSVLNETPNEKDFRTDHQALPVEAGIKYGANAWLHMRDFKSANDRGCS